MTLNQLGYPIHFAVDYPEASLNRLATFFRLITMIPILVVVVLMAEVGTLVLPPLLMILFRQKYPRWWFDWNLALLKFQHRVSAYVLLLRDEYPSTVEDQAVHLDIPYPDVPTDLNR